MTSGRGGLGGAKKKREGTCFQTNRVSQKAASPFFSTMTVKRGDLLAQTNLDRE
jgi:hypothetical protein